MRDSCIFGPHSAFGPNELKKLYKQVILDQSRKLLHIPSQEYCYDCKVCKCARYCSRKCLMTDWQDHKNLCFSIKDSLNKKSDSREVMREAMNGGFKKRREKGYSIDLEKIEMDNLIKESIQSEADVSWNVMQMAIPKESLFLWNGVYDVMEHTVQMDPSDFTFVSESFPAALIHRKQFREACIFIMWSTTIRKKCKTLPFSKVVSEIGKNGLLEDVFEKNADRTEDDVFKLPYRPGDSCHQLKIEDFKIAHLIALALLKIIKISADDKVSERYNNQSKMIENLLKEVHQRNESILPALVFPSLLFDRVMSDFKKKTNKEKELPWKNASNIAHMIRIYTQLYKECNGFQHIQRIFNFNSSVQYNLELIYSK
jgi:hypothetical protein